MRSRGWSSRSVLMALALGLSAPGLGACGVSNAQDVAKSQVLKVAIEGMTCDGCAQGIHAKVSKLKGVSETLVSFKTKDASITFDPAQVTEADIFKAIEQAGYKAKKVEAEKPAN